MKILVSGASGLIGSRLLPALRAGGHEAHRLARGRTDGLEGAGAVIHLAGESIDGRWTAAKKSRIRDSRVLGTQALSEALARLERPPGVLICASAIGYYGDRGDERLGEDAGVGQDFLAQVCRDWEAAAEPAARRGVRVAHLRFGMVLSAEGGALAKMLPPFRLGAGGPIGSGRQWWSWITLDDAVLAIAHVLANAGLSGPVNAVAPQPATNRDFARALGRVLRRPALLPMPAFAARLAFGEMADALLLSGARAHPRRLLESGFEFQDPLLEGALRRLLGHRS